MRLTRCLLGAGHWHEPTFPLLIERLVERNAKYDRVPFGERVAPRIELRRDDRHVLDEKGGSLFVGFVAWRVVDDVDRVGPGGFGACTVLAKTREGIGDDGTFVAHVVALFGACVVVNIESAHVVRIVTAMPLHQVFVGPRHCVRDAARELLLIFDRRHVGAKVHLRRQTGDGPYAIPTHARMGSLRPVST